MDSDSNLRQVFTSFSDVYTERCIFYGCAGFTTVFRNAPITAKNLTAIGCACKCWPGIGCMQFDRFDAQKLNASTIWSRQY